VVAEGWHQLYGGPHAEAEALKAAGPEAQDSIAFITLEPCVAHPGKKTPPCAAALIRAGVSRVIAAIRDPNPGVSGKGLALLRKAGVKTETGLCAQEARALNESFLARMRLGRPHTVIKMALSLDGKAFAEGGQSRWITGPQARRLAHLLRANCDAVLVGVGTVLADDPSLTSHGQGPNPIRLILDTDLRTPPQARILDRKAPTWIFTASKKNLPGAETIRVGLKKGKLHLRAVLKELSQRGIGRLLVEGGPTVHASFLGEGLVDEAQIFTAPKLISGSRDPNRAPILKSPHLKKIGPDFLFYGKVKCSLE
jgi:diaminohydroxyphosphoribosylaminopyrimidine deaminase/5-amino-6-(5-phosphoribosylamino)uracil reductase